MHNSPKEKYHKKKPKKKEEKVKEKSEELKEKQKKTEGKTLQKIKPLPLKDTHLAKTLLKVTKKRDLSFKEKTEVLPKKSN